MKSNDTNACNNWCDYIMWYIDNVPPIIVIHFELFMQWFLVDNVMYIFW